MNLDKVENALAEGDLSPYQAEVYVTLLELRDASATEIVESCTVPQPRIYDVLRELANKGYVETYEEEQLRARVSDPDGVTDDLQRRAETLSDTAETIEEVWERPPIGEHKISVFDDFKTVVDNAVAGIRSADNNVQLATTTDTFVEVYDALGEARENGVFVKLSLYAGPNDRKDVSDLENYLSNAATEVRSRKNPAPFLALVDGEETYFAMQQHQYNSYGMFLKDQPLSAMIYWYFQNALWDQWDTVYSARSDGLPREYVEIRQCVLESRALLDEGRDIETTVRGYWTENGDECTIEGQIIDAISPDDSEVDSPFSSEFVGQTTLVVEEDGERYTVGGLGAIVEDVRAARIVLREASRTIG